MRVIPLAAATLMALSAAAAAQGIGSSTQSRSGLGDAAHPTLPSNSMPAGSMNATTGPQSRPAYPSGSDTPNPGAGMVRANSPKPATGPAKKPVGAVKTVTIAGKHAGPKPNSPGVGEASTPPK